MNEELQSKLLEVVDKTGRSIEFMSEHAVRAIQIQGIGDIVVSFAVILSIIILYSIIFNGKRLWDDNKEEPTPRGSCAGFWCAYTIISLIIILVGLSTMIMKVFEPAGYLVLKVLT